MIVILVSVLIACTDDKDNYSTSKSNIVISYKSTVSFLDNNVPVTAEIIETRSSKIIRTYTELADKSLFFRYEDTDNDGTLDKIWDGQVCNYIDIDVKHQALFAKAKKASEMEI